ncbi:MAG: complex I NDUFA9 subunit family protein [Paracoccus sp. (in: a-proteobacteria)]
MSKIVTIYGGSGFVGRQIARRMARKGWRVRVAVRRPSEALFVRTYGAVGQVEPVPCNIRDDLSVRAAMADAEVVINCVGVIVNEGRNRFDAVHVEGAERIGRISAEAGVDRVVHISALGANADSASNYLSSKGRGEAAILKQRPDAVILRPAAIFGPDDGLFGRFATLAGLFGCLPISGGDTRMQPVYVEDVADAAMLAALGQAAPGIYELGGPEVMSVREIAQLTMKAIRRRRPVINLPLWVAGIQAGVLDGLSFLTFGLVTNRILTRDQLRMLVEDNVVAADAKGLADLGIKPTAPEAVVDEYLWRFRPGGQYSDMTASAENLRAR